MLYRLKRHPFPVVAHFRHCLVLTYALPADVLQPLLPDGLTLDGFDRFGFVALALVRTEGLRPAFLPPLFGQDFILSGFRIFARYRTPEGRSLRGLRILRSDTDSIRMAVPGNLLTHYRYHRMRIAWSESEEALAVRVVDPRTGELRLDAAADLRGEPAPLPEGSPFPDLTTARRYAGPLPFTFDYEPETRSIIRVQGRRERWRPMPVGVTVKANAYIREGPFAGAEPILASAFHIADVPYRWERGIRAPLPRLEATV